MNENRSIWYSGWLKAVGVILLCFLGAGIVYSGTGFLLKDIYFAGETADTFAKTEKCLEMMEDRAVEAVMSSVVYEDESYTYYSNVRTDIRSLDSGAFIMTNSASDFIREETFYVVCDQTGQTASYAVENPSDAPEGSSVYEVKAGLLAGYPYYDSFRVDSDTYAFARQYDLGAAPLIILVLLFLAVLIYEFTAAGHIRGRSGITLYLTDRVPYDAATVIYGTVLMFLFVFFASAAPGTLSFRYQLAWGTGAMMAMSLVIYGWLMTTARRVKAGGWYRSMILWKCMEMFCGFLRMIPAVPMAAFLSGIWLLSQWSLCSSASYYSGSASLAGLAAPFFAAGAVYCVWVFRKMRGAVARISAGELDFTFHPKDRKLLFGPFRKYADDLERIAGGMQQAIRQQMRSERLKAELITNVSHDIKTPLTSIISYVDLLQKEHTPEQEKEYLAVLERQSQRLKKLTEDVLEASKASTGNITVQKEDTNIREIIDQAVAEYEEKMTAAELTVIPDFRDMPLHAETDGRLLWRVLRNLLSNCAKYALPGTRVYIDASLADADHIRIVIKNTSADALNISADELMERFVRGDSSRHTEGSGLGLNIARSLTELLGGELEITIDGDLFKAAVVLPRKA